MTSLVAQDQACLWHPFTQARTALPPIPIVKGEGLYLYDEEGRCYLDAASSWWVNLHGHSHPYIAAAIGAQASRLEHVMFADFTHPPAVELATRLLSLLPQNLSKIFYSDNGSTAVETALKMALQYWFNQDPHTNKHKIVCFKKSYHGDTFGAMSASGKNSFNRPFWNHLFAVETIDAPSSSDEEACVKQLEAILKQGDVACFIFEPLILGVGGMLVYPAEPLNHLLKLCQEYKVLTIADEVMTGFGRTGSLFACDQLSVAPDFICLSKGLTGGFLPLGVTACSQEIFNAFLGDSLKQAFLHGHSYTGNPIACSSALASLDLLLKPSCFLQRELIAQHHRSFCSKWKSHPRLKRCECLGTLLILEYAVQESSYFQSLKDRLYRFFLDRNIIVRPFGNVLYISPPYCITAQELDLINQTIILSLKEVL